MGWIALMSALNTAAQIAVPSWVRGRALALYVLSFQGGMAVGSALWGYVAAHAGIPVALIVSALGLVWGLLTIAVYRLPKAEAADLGVAGVAEVLQLQPGQRRKRQARPAARPGRAHRSQ